MRPLAGACCSARSCAAVERADEQPASMPLRPALFERVAEGWTAERVVKARALLRLRSPA